LLKEPKLKVFYSAPVFDLKLMTYEEDEDGDDTDVWPHVLQLFGGDPDHQVCIDELMTCVSVTLRTITTYIKVLSHTNVS
jgi:hypothetical protein